MLQLLTTYISGLAHNRHLGLPRTTLQLLTTYISGLACSCHLGLPRTTLQLLTTYISGLTCSCHLGLPRTTLQLLTTYISGLACSLLLTMMPPNVSWSGRLDDSASSVLGFQPGSTTTESTLTCDIQSSGNQAVVNFENFLYCVTAAEFRLVHVKYVGFIRTRAHIHKTTKSNLYVSLTTIGSFRCKLYSD